MKRMNEDCLKKGLEKIRNEEDFVVVNQYEESKVFCVEFYNYNEKYLRRLIKFMDDVDEVGRIEEYDPCLAY